jgi:transcriptional regulator
MMYRPAAFAFDDRAALHAFIRANPFATVAAAVEGRVAIAYAPIVLDGDAARFHLAANNPVAQAADGARLTLSFMGPHAYISPDWYVTPGMVPTWNYSVVEGEGIARRLDAAATRALLDDLSAVEEAHLLPKAPWKSGKVAPERMAMLLTAIVGFSIAFDTLHGKAKLSQNVRREDFDGAVAGLEARGDAASAAVAAVMRKTR